MMDLYRANNAKFGAGDFEKGVGRNLRSSLQKLFKDKDTTSKFFKDFENSNESYRLGLIQERIAKPNEENPTLDTREPKFKGRGKEIIERLARNPEFTSEPLFENKRMQENLEREIALERIAKPTRTKPFTEVDDDFEDDFDEDNNNIPEENEIMLPSERQKAIDQGILREVIYDIEKGNKSPDRRIQDYQELLKEGSPLSSVLAREPEIKEAMEDRVKELNDELEMIEDLITEDRNLSEEAAKEVRRIANEIAQSQEYKDIVDEINQLTQEMKDEAASRTPEVSEMLKSIYDRFQEKDKIPQIMNNLSEARDKNVTKYKETLKQLQEELKKIEEYINDPDKLVDDIVKEIFKDPASMNLGWITRGVLFLVSKLGKLAAIRDTILTIQNRASIEMAKDIFRKKFGKDIPESDLDKIAKALYNNDKIAQFLVNMMKLFSMVAGSPARNDDDESER
jgi:methyl-accepting chemotaxis protein